MTHFSKRKYSGHIRIAYRLELIRLHLAEAKEHLSPPECPAKPWIGNGHLSVIGILSDTSLEWKAYRVWCKMNGVLSFKPVI